MGLVNPYMVKNAIGKTAGQTLELEADPGQSFLVKDIMIGGNNCEYADITVDKAMVGRFRTGGPLGSHLCFPFGMCNVTAADVLFELKPTTTILGYLGEKDIFKGYPVAEGQKIVISPTDAAEYLGDISIIYEEYDGGDINSDDENGSESTEYMIVNYGDCGVGHQHAGEHHIDTQLSPTEFPAFPYGKVVPAKTEIDLIGILASEVYDYDAADDGSFTKYLKLVRERTVLFDDDRNGLMNIGGFSSAPDVGVYIGHGKSVLGNYSTEDIKKPYMLPKPITFGPGEELNMYHITGVEAANGFMTRFSLMVGLIEKIRRVS